jgi:O-antigen/teichoic acid export membrane protein
MTTDDLEVESTASGFEEPGHLPRRSLESQAIRGTYFVVLSYGLAMGIRLVSNLVLSRLFMPEYFGLLALLTTVVVGLTLLSHIGVQDSIIQNPRGDQPIFLNTAWTLQVLQGLLVWGMTIVVAWPIARFYHEPRMIVLLPALGFASVISGFSSPSLLTLARHLGVGKLSALELVNQIVQFVVTLIWALIQPTIWALVAGRIASEVVRTIVSYRILPEIRPRFTWDQQSVRELIRFGRWILIGTALTFLALQSDRLILGKLISFQLLGVYGIAFTLSDIPRQIIFQFCSRIGYPFVSKLSGLPRADYRRSFLKYRMPVLAAGGLMLISVISVGDIVVLHIYTKPYHGAAWMVGIFALGLWHTMLYGTTNPAIMALQKAHYNAFAYLVYCVSLYILLPWGFHLLGMVGAVGAVAVSDLPVYFVTAYSASREGIGTLRQDAIFTLAFVTLLVLVLLARASLGFGWPFPHLP